ncbi:hypothetical protein Tco_0359380 [Tanacetum coccineum]
MANPPEIFDAKDNVEMEHTMDVDNVDGKYCLDDMSIGSEEYTSNGKIKVTLHQQDHKPMCNKMDVAVEEKTQLTETSPVIKTRVVDSTSKNKKGNLDQCIANVMDTENMTVIIESHSSELYQVKNMSKENVVKVNDTSSLKNGFRVVGRKRKPEFPDESEHLKIWVELLWRFRTPDGDWAIEGPHFCPAILGDGMPIYITNAKRGCVTWTDVDKVFSTWMTFGGNTRDLCSIGEETDEITDLHQDSPRIMFRAWRRRDLDMMEDKVDNPSPQSTPQVLPSFEVYTPPVTYPKEVEETLGTPIKVEPLEETQFEDLGLNTCNHDIPLCSREVSISDEPEPQPQPLPNFPSLDANLGNERCPEPPIKPPSPDSFRIKEVDHLIIHTPPSRHVASFHPKDTYCYYHPCIGDPKKHYGFKPGLLRQSGSLGRKSHLLEDKQIPSVGVFDEVFSTWMTFEENTRDLGSFGEETDEIADLHQDSPRIMFSDHGNGVRRFGDGVKDLATTL